MTHLLHTPRVGGGERKNLVSRPSPDRAAESWTHPFLGLFFRYSHSAPHTQPLHQRSRVVLSSRRASCTLTSVGASTSAPASTPPLPDRQHWFLVCPTLNPIEQRKTRRGRPQGTEQYGMVKQYGETVSLKQGCSVVRPATLDLGSGVSPAIVLAPGCRQRRSLSAPGCRTDSHDTPPSHSTQNSDRRPRATHKRRPTKMRRQCLPLSERKEGLAERFAAHQQHTHAKPSIGFACHTNHRLIHASS
jgi:hypothetical protein